MGVSFKPVSSVKAVSGARLAARLKMVDMLSLPEKEAAVLIRDMERDPLFLALSSPADGGAVLRRQRYPRTSLSSRFYEINESLLAGAPSLDVQNFLEERRGAAALVKSMGADVFERYFLHQEEPLSRPEIAERLDLTEAQVGSVFDFVLAFSAQADLFESSAPSSPQPAERVLCIGRIEGDAFEGFRLAYFTPCLARGRYRVDKDAWEKRRASLSAQDRRRAAELLRRVDAFNMRSDTFQRVLTEALQSERAYLAGGGRERLKVLSLRETARRLSLASSTVCRVVAERSVQLPWGEEVRLSDLFPQKKRVLREVLEEGADAFSGRPDRAVQEWLLDRYQLKVPRRTVNYWRRKIAAEENP